MRLYIPIFMRWMPMVVLFLAAYWRFHEIETQSFWHDEGNTLRLVQRDIDPLIDAVRPDIHPPGYYLVLKGWASLIGETEFGLRSLSAFCGILTVLFTYALGTKLYEAKAAGLLAAILVAANSFQVYYSQEARMYAQLAALTTMSLWLLAVMVRTNPKSRQFIFIAVTLGLVNTLGLYTQYTYPFTMLVQGLFFFWWMVSPHPLTPSPQAKRRKIEVRALLIYVAANLLTLILFAIWLPTAYDQITAWPTFDDGIPFSEKLSTIATYITYGNAAFDLNVLDFLVVLLLMGALILPDYYKKSPSHWWRVGLPLVWIGVVCGALLISGAYREANLKFLLPAQVGVALLVGRGAYLLYDVGSFTPILMGQFAVRAVAIVAFLAILSGNFRGLNELRTNPEFQRDNYKGIAETIQNSETPQDAIILNAPNQYEVFTYYYDGALPLYPLPRGYGGDDAATLAETQQIIAEHPRIFVLFWGEGERDPKGIVRNTLDSNAYEISSEWYGNVRLVLYAVLEDPPTKPTHVINQKFGENITLKGYAISGIATTGSILGVTLFWETDQPLDKLYKVTVQMLNPDGTLTSQHDSEPANGLRPTISWQVGETIVDNHGLLIKPTLTPGDRYTIIVGVYELDNPQNRLPVNNQESLTLESLSIR